MCERYSWVEKDGEVVFLAAERVYHTKRGVETQKHCNNDPEQFWGHSAIRFYHSLSGGIDQGCEDFNTPDNFPPELVNAIKAGEMREFGVSGKVLVMLMPKVLKKYEKIRQSAYAEFVEIRDNACAEYEKFKNATYAEYEKVRDNAYAEYAKIRDNASAKYQKIKQSAYAKYAKIGDVASDKYEKVKDIAYAECAKIRQPAYAKYQKIRQDIFWDLFKNPENRIKCWR